ncbi:tetratricopeptide repeat protein, partial [Klebsiella pneumoniae]|nr:tetratricopeptide repeat protein [Klebsiella pneumoniae]
DATNSLALTTLTSIYIVNNQRDKAIALLEQGRKAAPGNLDFILGLASLYSQSGNHQKALELLAAAPKEQANTPRLLATRAQIQTNAGQNA